MQLSFWVDRLALTFSSLGIGRLNFPQKYVRLTPNLLEKSARGPRLSTDRTLVFPKRYTGTTSESVCNANLMNPFLPPFKYSRSSIVHDLNNSAIPPTYSRHDPPSSPTSSPSPSPSLCQQV